MLFFYFACFRSYIKLICLPWVATYIIQYDVFTDLTFFPFFIGKWIGHLIREIVSYDIYQYKSGSRERGVCLEKIALSLNSLDEPWFKVDQRALRDRLKKLLGKYITKNNEEQKSSGIDVETIELDALLEEKYDKKHEWEVQFTQVTVDKNKKTEEEKKVQRM